MKLQRLPRSGKSGIQVIPCDPECDSKDCDVVTCITKFARIKVIDGFMSFDENVEARMRLAGVVRAVNGNGKER